MESRSSYSKSRRPSKTPRRTEPMVGFDVTQVIGRVTLGENGTQSPQEAAMLVIAQHGDPGDFQFPTGAPAGSGEEICFVSVSFGPVVGDKTQPSI